MTHWKLPPVSSHAYNGFHPFTWREWRSADFYTDRLILEE